MTVPVSMEAQRVYDAIGAYCFGEAEAWPSQARIADDLGCSREHVNRKVRELRDAGWFTVEKRVGFYGWLHNVYLLLEPWMPATQAFIRKVVARAKRRQKRPITLTGFYGDVEAIKTPRTPHPVRPYAIWLPLRT
jgi:biotin operon repressor